MIFGMRNKSLTDRLRELQATLKWKIWRIGIYDSGIVFLEFETSEQYDEYQFSKKSELSIFVYGLEGAATSRSQKDL